MVCKESPRLEKFKYVVIIEFIKCSVSSVDARPDGTTSAPTGRIFMKFDI